MLNCYVCDQRFVLRVLARIDSDDNAIRRNIAIQRRDNLNRPPLDVTDRTRLCINCNRSIIDEIHALELDPFCLRLNVLTQNRNSTCLICNNDADLQRLNVNCRANVFIQRNIYIPEQVRSCRHHLNEKGFIIPASCLGLRSIHRPCVIRGQHLQLFLQGLREVANGIKRIDDENSLTETEFECFCPMTKGQFQDIFTYCDRVHIGDQYRYITKRDSLIFLCKLRHGLSDEFLAAMFQYPSRSSASGVIATIRQSLMQRFVLKNIGFNAITRDQHIQKHVTPFSNELYNPEPRIPRVIAAIDTTYSYIPKSSNFRALRQSYSVHKGRHLVKPVLIVAPNGYIFDIQGPYFSDFSNNDASILDNEFERDAQGMRAWFQEHDIVLLDRGYRDAIEL